MNDFERTLVRHWTVDYCDGSSTEQVTVPHAWKQDIALSHEGPVVYRTTIEVPNRPSKLRFSGISYSAEITIDGKVAAQHTGIWDAFDVSLSEFAGKKAEVSVKVIKNGGPTYPVRDVASGFLPYVFHTFGGIHGEVGIVEDDLCLYQPLPSTQRVSTHGSEIYVNEQPFYMRGILHWGWYPDLGHTNPPSDLIRNEVQQVKKLGFNLIKFCLWVPSQAYLEIMKQEGLEAWIELPLWDPTPDPAKQSKIAAEFEEIVRQYRHHDNILMWTVGCELSEATSPEYRQHLVQLIKNLTGSPLVKDNSGGAEMYGGSLKEFGDFYDFHPYCELTYYPQVLDSLLPGPRNVQPMLLGEFNDSDVHRNLPRLANEIPYWCSTLSELNDQGVRWQHDLPGFLGKNRFAQDPEKNGHDKLAESSRRKTLFIRKWVQEAVRARSEISGYVITGMRDTPISTSGFFDDWDQPRFTSMECASWNSETCLFVIPNRRPPWVQGGNRPGYNDPFNQFVGQIFFKVGIHSECPLTGGLLWRLSDEDSNVVAQGCGDFVHVAPLASQQISQIEWTSTVPGKYRLDVEFENVKNSWTVWISEKFGDADGSFWKTHDPSQQFGFTSHSGEAALSTQWQADTTGLFVLSGSGTVPCPFWREAAYEFLHKPFWEDLNFAENWERFVPIAPDRALSLEWLKPLGQRVEILMNRVDVRTYVEAPVLVRVGNSFITTLRPFGGLGIQPCGIPSNAAGADLVRGIAATIRKGS